MKCSWDQIGFWCSGQHWSFRLHLQMFETTSDFAPEPETLQEEILSERESLKVTLASKYGAVSTRSCLVTTPLFVCLVLCLGGEISETHWVSLWIVKQPPVHPRCPAEMINLYKPGAMWGVVDYWVHHLISTDESVKFPHVGCLPFLPAVIFGTWWPWPTRLKSAKCEVPKPWDTLHQMCKPKVGQ